MAQIKHGSNSRKQSRSLYHAIQRQHSKYKTHPKMQKGDIHVVDMGDTIYEIVKAKRKKRQLIIKVKNLKTNKVHKMSRIFLTAATYRITNYKQYQDLIDHQLIDESNDRDNIIKKYFN